MFSKMKPIFVLSILLMFSFLIVETQAYCSLEKMKKFAMEACEHLFLMDEPREKRSLEYENSVINDIGHFKGSDKKRVYYNMRRSIFPHGGYLKVGHSHYMKLSHVDVLPKYKAKHLKLKHQHKDTKERFKRDHSASYNNIPYCCFNNCDEDFFC